MEAVVSKNIYDDLEWVSVSDLAKRLNVTNQTVYNKIRCGEYQTIKFKRGKYNGILVGVAKQK